MSRVRAPPGSILHSSVLAEDLLANKWSHLDLQKFQQARPTCSNGGRAGELLFTSRRNLHISTRQLNRDAAFNSPLWQVSLSILFLGTLSVLSFFTTGVCGEGDATKGQVTTTFISSFVTSISNAASHLPSAVWTVWPTL